jgi:hypothetical protein
MICVLDDTGFCARHNSRHVRELALDPGEPGERYRQWWDVRAGLLGEEEWKRRWPEPAINPANLHRFLPCCGDLLQEGYIPANGQELLAALAKESVLPVDDRAVAPLCGWGGICPKKPQQYAITAVIPHLETPEPLQVVIDVLRAQDLRPYIMVIDTGSSAEVCQALEELRAADLELHYIRAHAYTNSSEPVAVAQDLAFALCRSEYLFCTHSDVFLCRRDFLTDLRRRCSADVPVVGYEMSDRSWVTSQWRGIPSHTATLFHMPTMHRLGITWSMQRFYALYGYDNRQGWPDTESTMGQLLKDKEVKIDFLGKETNFQRHKDANLDHVRNYPSSQLYFPEGGYFQIAKQWMAEAMAEARSRLDTWQRSAKTSH